MIFDGEESKILEHELYIKKLKYLFKTNSRQAVSDIHSEDWELLEESMFKSMKDHFDFWNGKIEDIARIAKVSLKNLKKFHKKEKGNFKEFLENVESLLPKDLREIQILEDAKDVLFYANEFKDARYIKKRAAKLKKNLVDKTIKKRRRKIEHHQLLDTKRKEKEKDMLLYTILRAYEKMINRKKKEFDRLWVKYLKVKRIIENLHHQENCRLKELESKFFFYFQGQNFKELKIKKGKKIHLKSRATLQRTVQCLEDLGYNYDELIVKRNDM